MSIERVVGRLEEASERNTDSIQELEHWRPTVDKKLESHQDDLNKIRKEFIRLPVMFQRVWEVVTGKISKIIGVFLIGLLMGGYNQIQKIITNLLGG
jgi:hypothetical protein